MDKYVKSYSMCYNYLFMALLHNLNQGMIEQ